jgi:hypothetical protein
MSIQPLQTVAGKPSAPVASDRQSIGMANEILTKAPASAPIVNLSPSGFCCEVLQNRPLPANPGAEEFVRFAEMARPNRIRPERT